MTDLSHWDIAEEFSPTEAAALILGMEPHSTSAYSGKVKVVLDRMAMHYRNSLEIAVNYLKPPGLDIKSIGSIDAIDLPSVELEKLIARYLDGDSGELEEWLGSKQNTLFDIQKMSRQTIVSWLKGSSIASKYDFSKSLNRSSLIEVKAEEIDPSDLPLELDAANLAYRAIVNGYGDVDAPPRERLIAYLVENYPSLNQTQIERIATVANPDKSTGRKRGAKG